MAKRGTFYRCHLFTFSGPQTAGITSRWTKNLAPLGNREVKSGEIVEMLASISGDVHSLDRNSRIRFDVLEEDHLLTGLLDDRIVSYVGTTAARSSEDFPRVRPRRTNFRQITGGATLATVVSDFKLLHATDWVDHILVVEEPGAPPTFHVMTWWGAERLEDFVNSEFYFIVNVDDVMEDQSDEILDVASDAAHPGEAWRVQHPEAAGPFPVGSTAYIAPNFPIGPGLEGAAVAVDVSMEALVRYPADLGGTDVPVSTKHASYPLVVLAHGRHRAAEFERNPDGSLRIVGGHAVPIRDVAGNRIEFKNHEGLEYLATHFASHGFIAVSVNLNGKFNPVTGGGALAALEGSSVSCVPFVFKQAGIEHRGLTVLRHISEMRARSIAFGAALGSVPPGNEPELARSGPASAQLRQALGTAGIAVAADTHVTVEVAGNRWLLTDRVNRAQYFVKKEFGSLNVYRATVFHKIDFARIGLVGHSRGGDAVVSAHRIDKGLPPAARVNVKAIVSIAPTDLRDTVVDVPYLVMIGSDDGDIAPPHGLSLYDRATSAKQLVWVVGGIHNLFASNWQWQDEVAALPPVSRTQHQLIACGYAAAFLQQHLNGVFFHRTEGGIAPLQSFFTGTSTLAALNGSGVELFHASRAARTLVVDNFEDAGGDRTRNSLGNIVTATDVAAFDELEVRNLTPGCGIKLPNWFHHTHGLRLEWSVATARYTTALGPTSALEFDALSFRVGQDTAVGVPQDLVVRLTDGSGTSAALRVSDVGRIPAPRTKTIVTGRHPLTGAVLTTMPMTVSMLGTVRMPLQLFKAAEPLLDLGTLAAVAFEFSVRPAGRLVFDDIELSA